MALQIILNFLQQLSENNNRDWFHEHKQEFIKAKENFEIITEILISQIGKFDKEVGSLQAKNCIFRIYRDVRFSKDKSPYKTNFGAFLVPGGKKSGKAGYYLHLDPNGSFLAGGVYMPPSDQLKRIRSYIFEHTGELKQIISEPGFKNNFGEISGDTLKKAPRGFPADFPDLDLLKFKSYIVVKEFNKPAVIRPEFLNEAFEVYHHMNPFIAYLNKALT